MVDEKGTGLVVLIMVSASELVSIHTTHLLLSSHHNNPSYSVNGIKGG